MTKAVKHSGEKEAGIDLQMRLVPLPEPETEEKKEPETVQISIRINEVGRDAGDNKLTCTVPVLDTLNMKGVQYVSNLITVKNKIFDPKGWIGADTLSRRLDTIAKFLNSLAGNTFSDCQRKARHEFLVTADVDTERANSTLILSNEAAFEAWLKQPKMLVEMGYLKAINNNNPE